ncbi:type II toxin-antitoxin system death-on-curing family toxin [Asticcacaulis sp.]|uniref:type II toxin-antitoxin system death-on-curing family toxin n=1 Tax=Asticcacaulis sp. TaxID=1872648 RepID=UPI003F7CD36E
MTRYLTVREVLRLHDDQLLRHGGGSGVRDPGQLESALFRPQTGYYADLIAEAAALWESLSQNHPFIDGNKRTALSSMLMFLNLNGLDIVVPDDDLWVFVNGLYDMHSFRFEALEPWLREHAVPLAL